MITEKKTLLSYIEMISEIFLKNNVKENNLKRTVLEDIEKRLISIISRWNRKEFRDIILFTGLEEGLHYQPNNNIQVNSLIVIAVRNSLLEDLHTTAKNNLKLKQPLIDDKTIKEVTTKSIQFFNEINLEKLSDEITSLENDPYEFLPIKYPVTWNAFKHLVNCENEEEFMPLIGESPKIDFKKMKGNLKNHATIYSGIMREIEPELLNVLLSIKNKEVLIYVTDSFKTITRNIEKLFEVCEFILTNDSAVVTKNFVLSNGYVLKAKKILKPTHNFEFDSITQLRMKRFIDKIEAYQNKVKSKK